MLIRHPELGVNFNANVAGGESNDVESNSFQISDGSRNGESEYVVVPGQAINKFSVATAEFDKTCTGTCDLGDLIQIGSTPTLGYGQRKQPLP